MSWNGEWTRERFEKAKSLWADGLSASQIATELGGVTRSGVIGKLHREGCAKREKGYRWGAKGQQRAKRKATYTSGYSTLHRIVVSKERKQFKDIDVPFSDFLGITFDQLDETTCRFPRGDKAPYLFCGQPTQKDSSYCPHCHRVVYTGIPERPERKGFARSFAFGNRAA